MSQLSTVISTSHSTTLSKKTLKITKKHNQPPSKMNPLQIIISFFEEFVEVFFPEVHVSVDFTAVKPLSAEVHTDLILGKTRKLDIVMEVKRKCEDTVIIIHVEPQSYSQTDFNERMFQYFSLLYNKYRKPILPIAVFTYDGNRKEKNEFVIEFPFFHVLSLKTFL